MAYKVWIAVRFKLGFGQTGKLDFSNKSNNNIVV